jgi:hypothetical protein
MGKYLDKSKIHVSNLIKQKINGIFTYAICIPIQ